MTGPGFSFCIRLLLLAIVWGCTFMGEVGAASIEDIGNLVKGPLWNQTTIRLQGNHLSGPIPSELGKLTNLTYLELSFCRLSGPIPRELGNLTNLTYLSLSLNNLSGPIPPELGHLTNLTELILYVNNLSGPIPPALSNLTNLTKLLLFKNNLSGPIPPELGRLTNLTELRLFDNSLSGSIPQQLENLFKLSNLELSNNSLSGSIPPELGSLANLTFLSLTSNNLSMLIPPQLGKLTSLRTLDLYNNHLSGSIPPQLGSLTSLTTLYLYNNHLSGPIPLQLGNLTNLLALDLSNNNLSSFIPPKLGNLSDLFTLDLSNNSFSGPIPRELGNLSYLSILDLSNNRFSGSIPHELGNLSKLSFLDLSDNRFSGSIPYELGNLAKISTVDLSSNGFFGPIPYQLNIPKVQILNLSLTNTSCEGLDVSGLRELIELGLPCSPPPSFKYLNLSYITLSAGTPATKNLDLSSVPESCKFVNLTGSHPDLENIRFWGGCDQGCIVNLAGTGARLSRSTRREVCLNKISIFLDGDIPHLVIPNGNRSRFANTLQNQQGKVFNLSDPNFVDSIDLGPKGLAFTGVGLTRVQAGNLCGNPEAKVVAAVVVGAFAFVLLLVTFVIVVVARWRRRVCGSGPKPEERSARWTRIVLYLWGSALSVLPVVDIATDVLVLSEVWGAWPMWVILACVGAPFVVGAYMVTRAWIANGSPVPEWKGMYLRWLWPLPELGKMDISIGRGTGALQSGLLAGLLLPLGLLGLLVQDLLSVAERFGLHLAFGDEIIVFERYHDARVLCELLLESLPQAILQTALYVLGSSRATRIYIDRRIFVQSIVVSLLSLLMQYCCMLWEAVYEGKSLVRVSLNRFKSAGQPFCLKVTAKVGEDEDPLKVLGL